MRIGNVGIFVKDLAGAREFFEDYFGATLLKTYNEEENNYYSDILQLDEGAWIELMTKPEIVDAPKDPNRTGLAHICIKVNSRPELDRIVQNSSRMAIRSSMSRPIRPAAVRCVP